MSSGSTAPKAVAKKLPTVYDRAKVTPIWAYKCYGTHSSMYLGITEEAIPTAKPYINLPIMRVLKCKKHYIVTPIAASRRTKKLAFLLPYFITLPPVTAPSVIPKETLEPRKAS